MTAPKLGLLSVWISLLTFTRLTSAATCDPSTLDNSTSLYNVTVDGTTVFDIANATGRGVCDIGRENLMADVTITPNVGQSIVIPAQTCEPDNDSCLLVADPNARGCILGGPRLYYTVHGDTYEKIALRLNITTEAVMGNGATNSTEELPVGQFVKVPQCSPSTCIIQPYSFTKGVYKDLAEEFGTTVGQIMMLSPTYNYSKAVLEGSNYPSITLPSNCTLSSSNYTIIS